MTYVRWQFALETLNGITIGEILDAQARYVTPAIQAPAVAGFTILATNNVLDDLLTLDLNLKCYRNNMLIFHGPIVSVQMASDSDTNTPTIACTAADPSWRFEKRVMDRTAAGTTATNNRLTLAESIIGSANSDGETGVRTLGQTISGATAYKYGPYRKLSEIVAELGNTVGGFDWRIRPTEYLSGKIGDFLADSPPTPLLSSRMGALRPGVVFEYQGRANMRAPNFTKSMDQIANTVYSIPDEGPASNLGVRSKQDAGSVNARGLYQDVADTSQVTESTLRDSILDAHIAFRRYPRQIFTFSPDFSDFTGIVPEYGAEYQIGDFVRCRFLYNRAVLIDGYVRVYKMQFDIDESGRETLTPTVIQEDTA